MDECPTHYYRYRSLSGGAAEYVERTICHNELYFAKPASFNDPFDCRPSFQFEASDDEIAIYFNHLLDHFKPWLTAAERDHEIQVMFSNLMSKSDFRQNIVTQSREEIAEKIGVLCLSTVRDDILMWSHYADSHRGICLEFDGYFPFFANTQEVKYPQDRARVNPFRQSRDEMMEAALLTKGEHWKYEREWRLIEAVHGSGIYQFPPEALTGIILGAQISQMDFYKVTGWVKASKTPIKFYRSSPSDSTFSLNIQEIPV